MLLLLKGICGYVRILVVVSCCVRTPKGINRTRVHIYLQLANDTHAQISNYPPTYRYPPLTITINILNILSFILKYTPYTPTLTTTAWIQLGIILCLSFKRPLVYLDFQDGRRDDFPVLNVFTILAHFL